MKVVSCGQMRKIDNTAINEMGIPGIVLMENAAHAVVKEIKNIMGNVKGKNILVFCGKGNNGGDGYAIARHLYNAGANVLVVLLAAREDIKGDAQINLKIIEKMKIKILEVTDETHLDEITAGLYFCHLVVDAIYGTGINGEISGVVAEVIHLINQSGKFVVSVDIPSGVQGDTGKICGTCINADVTVTLALPKIGLLQYPGADHVGRLVVGDISISGSIIEAQDIYINTIEREYVKGLFPGRYSNSNKGDYGKVLIIAGSIGMTGAAVMAAKAALRTGSGLVTIGTARSVSGIIAPMLMEAMTIPLEDEGRGILSYSCVYQILEKMDKVDVLAFGPGLSNDASIVDILIELLKKSRIPVIIDADGINALAKNINVLNECNCPIVLTPHPGEMSRLTGLDIQYIQANRIEIARKYAKEWGVTVVLKGAGTVVALPDQQVFINCTGNPGMATGGAGDVLTGVIASLVGQGLSVDKAAVVGVYLHGIAGDLGADVKGQHSLVAGDIIEFLPMAIEQVVSGS